MEEGQGDSNNSSFFNQSIKTQRVVCQKQVQEFGSITMEAPAGIVIDPITGHINRDISLKQSGIAQIRFIKVFPGKVINQGVVPVTLFVNDVSVIKGFEIPFQGILECGGVNPGDKAEKADIQVEGFSILPIQLFVGGKIALHLMLTVFLEIAMIVTSERVIKVNAAEPLF